MKLQSSVEAMKFRFSVPRCTPSCLYLTSLLEICLSRSRLRISAPSEDTGNLFRLFMQILEMVPDHIQGLHLYFHIMKKHLSKKYATTKHCSVLCIAMITL